MHGTHQRATGAPPDTQIPTSLGLKGLLTRIVGSPSFQNTMTKHISKSDTKTNSGKTTRPCFRLGLKRLGKMVPRTFPGSLFLDLQASNAHFGPQRPNKNANPWNKLLQKILRKIHARNQGYPNAQKSSQVRRSRASVLNIATIWEQTKSTNQKYKMSKT